MVLLFSCAASELFSAAIGLCDAAVMSANNGFTTPILLLFVVLLSIDSCPSSISRVGSVIWPGGFGCTALFAGMLVAPAVLVFNIFVVIIFSITD